MNRSTVSVFLTHSPAARGERTSLLALERRPEALGGRFRHFENPGRGSLLHRLVAFVARLVWRPAAPDRTGLCGLLAAGPSRAFLTSLSAPLPEVTLCSARWRRLVPPEDRRGKRLGAVFLFFSAADRVLHDLDELDRAALAAPARRPPAADARRRLLAWCEGRCEELGTPFATLRREAARSIDRALHRLAAAAAGPAGRPHPAVLDVASRGLLLVCLATYPEDEARRWRRGMGPLGGLAGTMERAWWFLHRSRRPAPAPTFDGKRPAFDWASAWAARLDCRVHRRTLDELSGYLLITRRSRRIHVDSRLDGEASARVVLHEIAHLLLDHHASNSFGCSLEVLLRQGMSARIRDQEEQAEAFAGIWLHVFAELAERPEAWRPPARDRAGYAGRASTSLRRGVLR